jgi:hypothetical protein
MVKPIVFLKTDLQYLLGVKEIDILQRLIINNDGLKIIEMYFLNDVINVFLLTKKSTDMLNLDLTEKNDLSIKDEIYLILF